MRSTHFYWTLAQVLIGTSCSSSAWAAGVASVSADEFLSSLGVTTHVDQGISGGSYLAPLRYLGVRNVHDGGRHWPQIQLMNRQVGVRLDLIGEGNLEDTISTGKALAASGALLAFEGPNEPNNFPITFNGQSGGGMGSWAPVAQFQEALYRAVKSSPDLKNFPVFAVSEAGAEIDNVGLQFLTIQRGLRRLFPTELNMPTTPTRTTMFPAPKKSTSTIRPGMRRIRRLTVLGMDCLEGTGSLGGIIFGAIQRNSC